MLAASANPRRIDEDEFFAAPLIGNIDRIACRSREVAHNRSPILQDRIDEGRFADIRPSHDREREKMLALEATRIALRQVWIVNF